ncbi:MAG: YitT family protein [Clostridia bacterium]|nr:YitT family protein [Clostridia bacterium]
MINRKNKRSKLFNTLIEYLELSLATIPMIVGVYVFKFPNHFSFGGVTGIAVLLNSFNKSVSPSTYNLIINVILLLLAFIIVGRSFGIKTVYVTLFSSLGMNLMEVIFPMSKPLTDQPVIELVFAIVLPAVSTALLFNHAASAGGTEIIAIILRKFSSIDVGGALFVVDLLVTIGTFFVYGMTIGLMSFVGLMAKSLVIDGVIESLNRYKSFTIVCSNPEPICNFISNRLHEGATMMQAHGIYLLEEKTVILAVMTKREAKMLRSFINTHEPDSFIIVSNSSEIFGGGFHHLAV